jgi:hypothetical protein
MSTDLTQVLIWIVGIGAPSIVAYVLSFVVENFSWWATLPHTVKVLVPMVASVTLSVLASVFLQYPAIIAQIQPWFQVTMSAILAYLSTQKAYITEQRAGYGRRFSAYRAKRLAGL